MDAHKRYWALVLAFGIACGWLGWWLHRPAPVVSHTHTEFVHDTTAYAETVHDTIVSAPEAKGRPNPTIDLSKFTFSGVENTSAYCLPLPFFAVLPYNDSTGYDDLFIDTAGAPTIRHSKRTVTVKNTSTYASHERSSSDSSVTIRERNPLSLTVYFDTPVFQHGTLAVSVFETTAALALACDLGEHWSVAVQPELRPVLIFTDALNAFTVEARVGYRF